MLSRAVLTTVKAFKVDHTMKPGSVILLTDPKCTISVMEKFTAALKPFFHNKVSQYLKNTVIIEQVCLLEGFQYVPSELNPADLATRGGV